MGANEDSLALAREYPRHRIHVDAFLMDVHEVTNAAFGEFVAATGYQTVAERPLNWDEFKQQLPPVLPGRARNIFSRVRWFSQLIQQFSITSTIPSGGRGCWERIGVIRLDLIATWKGCKITPLFMWLMKMQSPTQIGSVSDFRLRQSGSGRPRRVVRQSVAVGK